MRRPSGLQLGYRGQDAPPTSNSGPHLSRLEIVDAEHAPAISLATNASRRPSGENTGSRVNAPPSCRRRAPPAPEGCSHRKPAAITTRRRPSATAPGSSRRGTDVRGSRSGGCHFGRSGGRTSIAIEAVNGTRSGCPMAAPPATARRNLRSRPSVRPWTRRSAPHRPGSAGRVRQPSLPQTTAAERCHDRRNDRVACRCRHDAARIAGNYRQHGGGPVGPPRLDPRLLDRLEHPAARITLGDGPAQLPVWQVEQRLDRQRRPEDGRRSPRRRDRAHFAQAVVCKPWRQLEGVILARDVSGVRDRLPIGAPRGPRRFQSRDNCVTRRRPVEHEDVGPAAVAVGRERDVPAIG